MGHPVYSCPAPENANLRRKHKEEVVRKSTLKLTAICAALTAIAVAALASDYPLGPLQGMPQERAASQACFNYCAEKERCSTIDRMVEGRYGVRMMSPYPYPSEQADGCLAYCQAICSPLASGLLNQGIRIGF